MRTFGEFKELTRRSAPADVSYVPRLDIHGKVTVPQLVHELTTYFGRRRDRKGLMIYRGGRKLAYVARADVYAMAPATSKGVGAGDGAYLAGGVTFKIYVLECPVLGCNQSRPMLRFDRRRPPKCPVHKVALRETTS
jgi:hypothetical protein